MDRRFASWVVSGLILAATVVSLRACHRPKPPTATPPVFKTSEDGIVVEVSKPAPPTAAPESAAPETPARLAWKEVTPDIAGLATGKVPGHHRRSWPIQVLVNMTGDHARWWGMNAAEAQRRQLMFHGIRRIDEELVNAWDGVVKASGPHDKGESSDAPGLAAYLVDVAEGRRPDVADLVGRKVEDQYAFDDPASATRTRALIMLGNFSGDPTVLDYLRRQVAGGDASTRGFAAAGLVRLGQEAGVLDSLGGEPDSLRVFLSAISIGTWAGGEFNDPLHAGSGFVRGGPESKDPQLMAGLVAILDQRLDRPTFLAAVRVLNLYDAESSARRALTPLWDRVRTDPELAVALMENRYHWRGSPAVTQIYNEMATGENARLALLALHHLYAVSDAASVGTLVRLLGHEDVRRVRAAAMALRGGGAAHADLAIPALEAVIARNSDALAVEQARETLSAIKGRLKKLAK